MTAIEKLLNVARNEIGYLEKETNANLDNKTANAGDENYNKYARDLDKTSLYNGKKNGYAWCSIFVDWCFNEAFGFENMLKLTCQSTGSYGASCTSSAGYFKKLGRFHTANPMPGDKIFFTNDRGRTYYHTGIVESIANGNIYTIEGNTSSAPGVVANGGAVERKCYKLTYNLIGGYGRPDYSIIKEEVEEVQAKPVEVKPTTRTGTVTAQAGLNARSGPGTNYKQVGAFTNGAKLTIHETKNGWHRVTGNAGWGDMTDVWVSATYVR